jgi:glycosyltransferase involved in cell wall biosynthesis
MISNKPLRVMWLLNHSSARKFEIQMMKRIGVEEIFTPKSYPQQTSFRSASVSYDEDRFLSIPDDELTILNAQDWYGAPSKQAWDIANKYFSVLFFILFKPEIIKNIANNFNGAVLWRGYGLVQGNTHGKLATTFAPNEAVNKINSLGRRFWFAQAYPRLHEIEPEFISSRRVCLPLGLASSNITDGWNGEDKRIYFVCADIETNSYYKSIFEWFTESFSGIPFVIGGAQAIPSDRPEVLGYIPLAAHEYNMRAFRLMFYHSMEPNHIHDHPFEAIRAGMPLVFMAGGMLDRMGGTSLPGRCQTVQEARSKIQRILNDDWGLINSIRQSQSILLEPMKVENCVQAWREGFQNIITDLTISHAEQLQRPIQRKRIAVILPIGYRGDSLRSAKLLAQAIYLGSRMAEEATDVIFVHLDDADSYSDEEFADLYPEIKRRTFNWKMLSAPEARRAMRYAGHTNWEPQAKQYQVVDDGIKQLQDCDLWIVISDRINAPILPLRPCIHMIYDYLQRYVPILPHGADQSFLDAARHAEKVLVTTKFTQQDAMQYAGLPSDKVIKVPMLTPDFSTSFPDAPSSALTYFIWTTNLAPHKNHEKALKALKALKWYYDELDGQLNCHVTGVNTGNFLKSTLAHLASAISLVNGSKTLRQRVQWLGELNDKDYQRTLANAAFLWHVGSIDNGTFSVIEAASLGVPALSSDYPAIREIDQQFELNLAWMNADDPKTMAKQLKHIEKSQKIQRTLLPSKQQLAQQNVENLAGDYWKVVRECL